MIDHYEIRVPASIKAGESFQVTVYARDASSQLVDDNATVVTLSASTADILFDGDGDEIYGEPGDAVNTLVHGVIELLAIDSKATEVTISVSDTGGKVGSVVATYNFNAIIFFTGSVYEVDITIEDSPRYSRGGGTVPIDSYSYVETLAIDPDPVLIFVEIP